MTAGKDNDLKSAGLRAAAISHAFGANAVLDNVSVDIGKGDVACLLGPSGCGKTTLLRVIAGLERLQAGRVEIGARIVGDAGRIDLPPEKRSVGLMFQDYALFPHLTVFENIAFGLETVNSDAKRRIEDRLGMMGLAAYRDRYPHELSGGQQQRVALLRATAPNPDVLLLDEPFTGLDTTLRSQVREQALEYLGGQDQTAMMVTHDPEEAMYMADKLFVMNDGVIVQAGSPIDVYARPISPFVAGLFGPLNELPASPVVDSRTETPFGAVATDGLDAGARVAVLVRPEHVRIAHDGQAGLAMSVVWCRSIGRSTQVKLASDDGPSMTLMSRVEGAFKGHAGARVNVTVSPEHMLVFPATTV